MDLRLHKALRATNVIELADLLHRAANDAARPDAANEAIMNILPAAEATTNAVHVRDNQSRVIVRFVPGILELRILQGVTLTGDGALHIAARHGREDQVHVILRKAGVLLEEHEAVEVAGRQDEQRRRDEREVAEPRTDTMGEDHQQRPTVPTTAEASLMLFGDFLRARNKMGETCLHEAVQSNSKSLVDLLLAVDGKVRYARSPSLLQILDHDGMSPLYLATTLCRVEIIEAFTANNKDSMSSAGPQGRTALHAAVMLSKDLCETLLQWNLGLAETGDDVGRMPIHYLGTTDTDIMQLLLEKDSSTGYCPDSDGWLPIHVAASKGRIDIVRVLVEKCPDCILSCNTSGQTFLHVAVHNGHTNVVGYACREKRFSNILNMRDLNGDTALHVAVQKGDEFVFWLLLRNNHVCLSFINRQGKTPLDLAVLAIEGAPKFKYKWEWIRDDLVSMGADLSWCRWHDLKVIKIRRDYYGPIKLIDQVFWDYPIKLIKKIRRDGSIKFICEVFWDYPIKIMRKLININNNIRRDGPIKFIREVLWDYPIKRVHEKTDDLIFSSSIIPERDHDKESERLGKAAAVLAAGALLILTLSFQAPLNAADKKPHSTDQSELAKTRKFIKLVPVDTVSMAAAVLSIFFCTIAGFPTRRIWIRSKALFMGGILLGAAAVAILLVFSLGLSMVYDYPRWWMVMLVYGVITVVTLLSFSYFVNKATRTGSPRQILAWVLARCQRSGLLNFGSFLLQQLSFIAFLLPLYAFAVLGAIWFLFQFLVK